MRGKNFFELKYFFVVLDDKFDVPGKATSYPVAEVSEIIFIKRSYDKCILGETTTNLMNDRILRGRNILR